MTPTTEEVPVTTITPAQYMTALNALGLDPMLTVSVSITSDWAHMTLVQTDKDGAPVIELGRLVTHSVDIPIRPEGAPT